VPRLRPSALRRRTRAICLVTVMQVQLTLAEYSKYLVIHSFLDADLDYWRNVSIAGFGVAALLGAYEYYVHVQHHASGQHYDPELNNYPYMKMRSKSYPWSCADCGLFDQKWFVRRSELFTVLSCVGFSCTDSCSVRSWDECKGRGGGHH
jgi:hypothetical protein